jgi:hypothetical protein
MIERYLEDLWAELDAVGIRGRLRRRILLETEDHLRSEPDVERFGSPAVVADRFADELATTRTRGAANATFVALAAAGVGYAVALGLANRATDIFAGSTLALAFALPAAALLVLAPQIAFVAGVLAAVRSLRRRSAAVIPAPEVRLLRRQTGTALAAGGLTVVALAVFAVTKGGASASWWTPAVLAVCGAAALPLAWAAVRFLRSVRLQPQAPGPPGDAYDDLGPLARFRSHPWLFCTATTGLAALAVFAAGALAGQPDEGLRNAVMEASWVAAGFSLLGPSLGLTPAPSLKPAPPGK